MSGLLDMFEGTLTPEQRFALVQQERIDALCDELAALRRAVEKSTPPETLPPGLLCRDKAAASAAAFVRVRTVEDAAVDSVVEALRAAEHVASFCYFVDKDAADADGPVHALVRFEQTVVVSHLGVALAGVSGVCGVWVHAVPSARVGSWPLVSSLFQWYAYHICHGQERPALRIPTSNGRMLRWCGASGRKWCNRLLNPVAASVNTDYGPLAPGSEAWGDWDLGRAFPNDRTWPELASA
jgi:hypothetical protein